MTNPIISLIIPVYNVEKYLRKAFESVQSQTFKDFEVIIINDGSTDNSLKIILEFCKKNKNFVLINQENSGPAAARNTALKVSKGEYIAFMDSDDYLEPNFLECLYEAAKKNEADMVCCNFNIYYPEKDIKVFMPIHSYPGVYSKTKALKKLILDIGTHYFVWNKLTKRELFFKNNISFDDMYFEDISISPKLFYYSKKIVFLNKVLYNYSSRESSILHSINVTKINDFIKSLGVIRNFFETENVYKEYNNHVWIYAQKSKIVSYYYILCLHAKASNFKGFIYNITAAKKSIDYFVSNDFKPVTQQKPINIPYPIKQPSKIRVK